MTINDLGSIGSFLAAIAVFITLIYLARQVRQGNILARYQARQNMMEKDLETLNTQISNLDITRAFMKENPTELVGFGGERIFRSVGHPWPGPALIPGASRSKYVPHRILSHTVALKMRCVSAIQF